MIAQGNEVVLLVLGIGVLLLIVGNRHKLKYLPAYKILLTAFLISFTGWVATVIEAFLWENTINAIEHICYMVSAIFLAIWCWKAFHRPFIALGKTERRKS